MRTLLVLALILALPVAAVLADEPPVEPSTTGEVTLTLTDYLALKERIERIEREATDPEPALAELVSQDTTLRVDDDVASVTTTFELEVRGNYRKPLALPFTGLPETARVEPSEGAALHRVGVDRLAFVPRQPGSYRVIVEGAVDLGPRRRVDLAPTGAPVSSTLLDLPENLSWRVAGAVVVDETVETGRRRVRLTLPRNESRTLVLERNLDEKTGDEERLIQAVEVTLVDLDPAGATRTDMVLYEMLQGGMETFEITLPGELEPTAVSTDEGPVIPRQEGRTLVVERQRRLHGVGWVAVSSPAPESTRWPLEPTSPTVPVRARYLVLASQVAARVEPTPSTAWSRVDLGDLPQALREDLASIQAATAWRWTGEPGDAPALEVDPLPPAASRPTLISHRETTTLWSQEGSLVHQDRFDVRRGTTALTVTLAPDTVPWSASVDGVEVRPVIRGNRLSVPLSFQDAATSRVEVVTLEERPLPDGRDELAFTVPRVDLPVLDHQWRLLLAENRRYRLEEGTLAHVAGGHLEKEEVPVASEIQWTRAPNPGSRRAEIQGWVHAEDGQLLPGATVRVSPDGGTKVTDAHGMFRFENLDPDRYEIRVQLDGFRTITRAVRARAGEVLFGHLFLPLAAVSEELIVTAEAEPVLERSNADEIRLRQQNQKILMDEMQRIQQGLVGGVKPLPVEISEAGKVLVLSGALPPSEVSVTLRVKRR